MEAAFVDLVIKRVIKVDVNAAGAALAPASMGSLTLRRAGPRRRVRSAAGLPLRGAVEAAFVDLVIKRVTKVDE